MRERSWAESLGPAHIVRSPCMFAVLGVTLFPQLLLLPRHVRTRHARRVPVAVAGGLGRSHPVPGHYKRCQYLFLV